MTVLQAIRDRLDRYNPAERKIAAYMLEHPREVVRMTISELAGQSGGSMSTVSRLCRQMSFRRFADFKMKLAAELAQPVARPSYQDIVAGNPLADIVSAIEANHIRSIRDTTRLLDLHRLQEAIEALHDAGRIDLYGVATSGVVAQDFYQKLIRIGKRAAAFSDAHLQLTSASTLAPGDVAVGISYSGETPETVYALRCAADHGATTISLTKFGTNPLSKSADIALFTSTSEAGIRRGDMASRIVQLHAVDVLFTGLVSAHFDEYVPLLERSFRIVRRYTHEKEGRGNEHSDV